MLIHTTIGCGRLRLQQIIRCPTITSAAMRLRYPTICQTRQMPEVSAFSIIYYYWIILVSSTTLFRLQISLIPVLQTNQLPVRLPDCSIAHSICPYSFIASPLSISGSDSIAAGLSADLTVPLYSQAAQCLDGPWIYF